MLCARCEEKLVSCLQGKCSHTFLSFTQYNLVFVPSFPWWVVLFGFKKRRTAKKTIPGAYFCRMDPLMTSSSSKSASLAIKSSLFPVLSTPTKSRCSTESDERKKSNQASRPVCTTTQGQGTYLYCSYQTGSGRRGVMLSITPHTTKCKA